MKFKSVNDSCNLFLSVRTSLVLPIGLILLSGIILLAGCSVENAAASIAQDQEFSTELFAMDTYMTLKAYGEHAQEALEKAEQEIFRLDQLLSTGSSDSEIGLLNQSGQAQLSEIASYLMTRSLEVSELSGGAFNPMIYPLMEAWGFTDEKYQIPEQSMIDSLLPLTDLSQVRFEENSGKIQFGMQGMKIDFGGIAKGYTSARVMEIFRESGVSHAVISLGGNVQVLGSKPDGSAWKVAIRNPNDNSGYLGILNTIDQAVITSGGYERYFEENGVIYHHILDPSTGYPANNGLISVTIISDDGTLADGLSTALYVAGLDRAEQIWKNHKDLFDAVFLTSDNQLYITEGVQSEFMTSQYPVHVISAE